MQTGSRMAFLIVVCLVLAMSACNPASPAQDPVGGAASDGELSEAQVLEIVRSSLAAYPWRLEQSVLVKETGQTITSLTEAQSSTRG